MAVPIKVEELEDLMSHVGFLSYLVERKEGKASLYPIVEGYDWLYHDILKSNAKIPTLDKMGERIRKLCDEHDYKNPEMQTWINENETFYAEREQLRDQAVKLDINLRQTLPRNGATCWAETQEYKRISDLSVAVCRYLEQEQRPSRAGIPPSGMKTVEANHFRKLRGNIKEGRNFWDNGPDNS